MKVKELIGRLGFDIDDKALKQFDNGIASAKAGMIGLTGAVVGASAVIFGLVKTAANSADELYKMALTAGLSVEELQKLGYVASVSGASVEELAGGVKFLSKNLYEANKNATGETAKGFRALGIRTKTTTGEMRNVSEVIGDVSAKFSKLKNPGEKAALAMQMFGRSGGNLIEFLNQGPDKIRELSAELDAFGGVLSEQSILTLKGFNDALTRLFRFVGAIRDQLAVGLAPALTEIVDGMREFMIANKDVIKENLTGFVKGLASFLKVTWKAVRFLGNAFAFLVSKIGGAEFATKALIFAVGFLSSTAVVGGIIALVKGFIALAGAISLASASAIAIPAAIVAALAALFLIIEDIYAYTQGKDSVFGLIINALKQLTAIQVGAWLNDQLNPFVLLIDTMEKALALYEQFAATTLGRKTIELLSAPKPVEGGGASQRLGFNPNTMNPATAPLPVNAANGAANTNVNINAPVTVTVPPNTDPAMVGEKVESGMAKGIGEVLREAGRLNSPAVGY